MIATRPQYDLEAIAWAWWIVLLFGIAFVVRGIGMAVAGWALRWVAVTK